MQLLAISSASAFPGFANARIAATGDADRHPRIAPHRRRYTLTRDDVLQRRRFDDAVARSAYPIDIHNPSGSGTTTHRLPPGNGLRDSLPLLGADQPSTAARRRSLHLDDARSAGVDAPDADRDDARSSGRNRGGARVRSAACAPATSTRATARAADRRRRRPAARGGARERRASRLRARTASRSSSRTWAIGARRSCARSTIRAVR